MNKKQQAYFWKWFAHHCKEHGVDMRTREVTPMHGMIAAAFKVGIRYEKQRVNGIKSRREKRELQRKSTAATRHREDEFG